MKILLTLLLLAAPISERNPVLRYLNDLCGDTWCEGTYSYRFKRITCSEETCTLDYYAKREGAEHDLTCEVKRKDYRRMRGWIIDGEEFHEYKKTEPFMESVNGCIEHFEWLELET